MWVRGRDGGEMVIFFLVRRIFWSKKGFCNCLKFRREVMCVWFRGDIGSKKRV